MNNIKCKMVSWAWVVGRPEQEIQSRSARNSHAAVTRLAAAESWASEFVLAAVATPAHPGYDDSLKRIRMTWEKSRVSITRVLGEHRVVLSPVSWPTYVALSDETESAGRRMTFDCGVLEIMSPMMPHETAKRLLARMIDQFTLWHALEIRSSASTTFRRQDIERGFEADESYYVQSAALIRGKESIDLSIDPPPDIVIEIEISRSALDKLSIFGSIGIPEVWRYDGQSLRIAQLRNGRYELSQASSILPDFPITLAQQILARRIQENETLLIQEFIRSLQPPA